MRCIQNDIITMLSYFMKIFLMKSTYKLEELDLITHTKMYSFFFYFSLLFVLCMKIQLEATKNVFQ